MKKHNKIVMLARSKLNSLESKISEALMNNQISHEDFMTIINEERNYRELKESIRMMKGQEDMVIINFKAKDSAITPYPLCLGGLSKDFPVGYMRATGLTGYVYDFSIDYWAIANDTILDIHKYLMKKKNII